MRLVHISDLHLGFRAYFQIERGWNRRERDLAAAFRWALQETVRLKPGAVLVTGDVFDNPNPPNTAFLTIHRGISHLRAHLPGVPILIIAGERDSPRVLADPGPVAVLDSLAGVEAAAGAPRAVRLRSARLHALLVPFRAAGQPPFPDVRPDPSAKWNVLLVRADPSASGQGIAVDPTEWSYIAVGGHHQAIAWAPNVHTAGALERPGPSPWRETTEERGFLSFDLEKGAAEFHPVPGRPVVDLAPVRVAPDDPDSGTRRLRELLQGVPGGVEGKVVRARLRGDVIAPAQGVSQGLLDAVRRRAAHLEVHVEPTEEPPHQVGDTAWAVKEIHAPGVDALSVGEGRDLPSITLITSESDSIRAQMVETLRQDKPDAPSVRDLWIRPPPPADPTLTGLWAGGWDPGLLLGVVLDGLQDREGQSKTGAPAVGAPPSGDEAEGTEASLAVPEAELADLRGDWIEASGDLEAGNLQWAQERQEADSKLQAYRDRAGELRSRIRSLEAEKGSARCPTCGRAMGDGYSGLLETLRGEWENVVQDGRWWKRRREQLDAKSEELQRLEEKALRLQARVEEAAEALERRKERVRGLSSELIGLGEVRESSPGFASPRLDEKDPDLRQVLRLAGSLLVRITEGRIVGVRANEAVRVVLADGHEREPVGAERAALRLATHLALWLHSRSKAKQTGALLVWQLHETAAEELFRGTLEVLSDAERFPVPVLMVAPPMVLDHAPGAFSQVLELTLQAAGRREFRRSERTPPILQLSEPVPAQASRAK